MESFSCIWKFVVVLCGLQPLAAKTKCSYPKEILGVQVNKTPSSTSFIDSLDIPENQRSEAFVKRLRTHFLAPENGTYTFYLACDDNCQFLMSTDWKQENLKTLISVETFTRYREWTREKPIEVNLSADHFYLIESTWQQNKGRYHFSVGVKFPTANHTLPVIISKEFLAKYTPPVQHNSIKVRNTSSTSLLVKWKFECPVRWPDEQLTIFYKAVGETAHNITVNASLQAYEMRGLTAYTKYCVRVQLATIAGIGQQSQCVFAMTDQDAPFCSPTRISARNNSSPTKIRVSWQAFPNSCWQGISRGYSMLLQVNKTAHKENKTWSRQFFLGPSTTGFLIEGLQTYTTYSLQVAARTDTGPGPYSEALYVDTCRCPKKFIVNWVQASPLSFTENDVKGTRPAGILPKLLHDMIHHTCGVCHGHKRTMIIFREEKLAIRKLANSSSDHNQLNLPISMERHVPFDREEYVFLPVLEVAGIAVLMRKPSSGVYALYLGSAVMHRWPVVLMMFALHCVFGLAMWSVEKYKNPSQFSPLFTKGWSQGIWCAIITMTTVGYGDRYPVSVPGKLLVVVSLLVGVVMDTLFIASMTASLTVFVMDEAANPERGRTIGVVSGSVEQPVAMRMNGSKGVTCIPYPTREAVLQGLKSGALDGVIMDVLTMDSFVKDLSDSNFEVAKIIPKKFHYGIILSGDLRYLIKDFREYVKSIRIESFSKQLKHDIQDMKESPRDTKPTVSSEVEVIPFFDPRNVLYQRTVKVTGIALVGSVVIGLLYHMSRERFKGKQGKPRDARPNVAAIKAEMKQLVDEFHNRMQRRCCALRIKHRKELLQLREKPSGAVVKLKSYRRIGSIIAESV